MLCKRCNYEHGNVLITHFVFITFSPQLYKITSKLSFTVLFVLRFLIYRNIRRVQELKIRRKDKN